MENKWFGKKILCIRPDNMGDILMSTPAIQALKKTFNCHITLLASSMGKPIAAYIPCIDDIIVYDLPWVKSDIISESANFNSAIKDIKRRNFDGAIIFNVYSQNPLPSVMIAYLANIPLRLAYCRENPYGLLTDWLPDKEPYSYINHQVKRDLALVEFIGAKWQSDNLVLSVFDDCWPVLQQKLLQLGVDLNKKWLIAHACVSEDKRIYPKDNWIKLAKEIIKNLDYQVIFTGSKSEALLTEYLAEKVGKNAFSIGGKLTIEEFLLLIKKAPLVISVNTVTIHIAAATKTPIIVLYALTNPQHLPWRANGKVLIYQVPDKLKSKNEVVKFVADNLHLNVPEMLLPNEVFKEVFNILQLNQINEIPEML